ncbi:hypothetical protein Acr_00g0047940 [Actinidia rufa]|uniref:Helitron helicase-like domain-containing protein n=1 Tax=Actinidia rufa TaxID=165716 RepID=A0A7J0DJW5_9ERIC|nr:hypothetical protein Acr_00g0047940 [Actinidia rufa]
MDSVVSHPKTLNHVDLHAMPPPQNLGEAFLAIDVNKVITRQAELPLDWSYLCRAQLHPQNKIGAKMDSRLLAGRGPTSFTIHGELRHRTGALLPQPSHEGIYAQLYIYDPDSALNIRNRRNPHLRRDILQTVQDTLLYAATDRRRYNLPTSDEIGVILPGDGSKVNGMRDIVLHLRGNNELMRISECHPAYLPLHYVLLFPHGELGWEPQLKQWDALRGQPANERLTQLQFYSYRLFERSTEYSIILRVRKLFQEFLVDAWAATEQNRLNYNRLNKGRLRTELYKGLTDIGADGADKIQTCAQVDMVVSVEFPSPEDDPILFETVKSVMVHGPCGARNSNAPCLDSNGRCTKRYPRAFAEGITMDQDRYPIYHRRNNGKVYTVKGQDVDNRDVVPYNAYLSKMFNCHINVEVCAGIRCVKYIHKYIYKGYNCTTMVLGGVDEIQQYIDSRYIGAPKAARAGGKMSTLTGYFACCASNEAARAFTYQEFPQHFAWQKTQKIWTPRQRGYAIGRMYFAAPNSACVAMGLLEDDEEWMQCLQEASIMNTGYQLRRLFSVILT